MNPIDELTNSLINHNLFFFAGSGISIQAGLPSVSDVLSGTYKKYLPDIIKGDYTHGNKRKKDTGTGNAVNALKNGQSNEDFILSIQPELFYSTLIEGCNGNTEVLSMWQCMHPTVWKTIEKQNGISYHPEPTIEHYFIAAYSWLANVPVFTTNYDTMLETACEYLNIPYEVLIFSDEPNYHQDSKARAECRLFICKIHGDINRDKSGFDASALKTTMESITEKNKAWLDCLLGWMNEKDICFCGYSGRDIDYFPFIKDFREQKELRENNEQQKKQSQQEHRKSSLVSTDIFWMQRYDESNFDALSPVEKTTLENAASVKAIVINAFPSDVFPNIMDKVFRGVFYRCGNGNSYQDIDYSKSIENSLKSHISNGRDLKAFLNAIVMIQDEGSAVNTTAAWQWYVFTLLLHRVGRIREAADALHELRKSYPLNSFDTQQQLKIVNIDMMISREQCRLITYEKRAKELRRLAEKYGNTEMEMTARLQIIGAHHLEIPSNLSFPIPIMLRGYLRAIKLFLEYKAWLIAYEKLRDTEPASYKSCQFLQQECKVRYLSLNIHIATMLHSQILKERTAKAFKHVYLSAYDIGNYTSVIGACKYLKRLEPENPKWNERVDTFSEIVDERSAKSINNRGSMKAIEEAKANDNVLNVVKGYLAIASKKPNKPRLNEKEMKEYWKYVERMESKHLGKVVSYITKIYLEHFNFAVLSLPVYLAQTEHILRLSDIFPKHHIYHLNLQHIQCFYWLNNG